jgi:16S rRNA (adenine1518-N6/adenine1519-N6)-dimethyltransferase
MVKLGQNFLADTNLLDAIVRDAKLSADDVVLEVGAGEGPLTERLATVAGHVHTIELDRKLEPALEHVAGRPNVDLHWGDALKLDLAAFEPAPTAVVSNLPYSIATPLIVTTIEALPMVRRWIVMVQIEIAERLSAGPRTRAYGAPSVLVQLACETRVLRKVNPAVFRPRPRVESAILGLERYAPGADADTRDLVRTAFAHRRKTLARSLSESRPGILGRARMTMKTIGVRLEARPEEVNPWEYAELAHGMPWRADGKLSSRE